jgi:hypothetical protein
MNDARIEPQVKALSEVEAKEKADGQFLFEMTQTPGFDVLKGQLESMAFHSWIDPREIEGPDAKKEWEWRELNGFHAANNAKELLNWIQQSISRAEYLEKKKRGDIGVRSLAIK